MALAEGRFADAADSTAQALAFANRLEARDPAELRGFLTAQAFLRYRELGDLTGPHGADSAPELERAIAANIRDVPTVPGWRAGLAWLHALQGRWPEAREGFEELFADGLHAIPVEESWPATMVILSELCYLLGDRDRAEHLRELLLPYQERCAVIPAGMGWLGSVAHYLGQLATVLNDWKEADDQFQRALAVNRRLAAPPLVARTQYQYARMLLTSHLPGRRAQALQLLDGARSVAHRLGMTPLQRQITLIAA